MYFEYLISSGGCKSSLRHTRLILVPHTTGNMAESTEGTTERQQRTPSPESSPITEESVCTESDQEELDGHNTTMYAASFHFPERIYTGQISETIAQIERLMLKVLEQIVAAPLEKSGRDPESITQTHSSKVEIHIADRRKDKSEG